MIQEPVSDPLTILTRTLNLHRQVQTFWQHPVRDRLRNYEMVTGKQWPKEDYNYLTSMRRSADVYNFILPIMLVLSGTQKINRQKLRAYPVSGGGDEELAQVITKALRWSFNQCDKDFQFSRAFLDAVIGRIGWMKSYWSTDWDPEGMWYTDWHDPFRILFDPETQGDFHRTCNYLFDTTWMTGEALINTFAGENPDLAAAMEEQQLIIEGKLGGTRKAWSWRDNMALMMNVVKEALGVGEDLDTLMNAEWVDQRNGLYKVIELHEKRFERRKYVMDTVTGETILVPKKVADNQEMLRLLMQRNTDFMLIVKNEPMNYVTTLVPAFSSNPIAGVPQDAPYDIQNQMFVYTPVLCYDMHPDITETRSVVDALVDPQQSYNKLESTLKDYIVRFVGHGWIYKEGAIALDDMKDWQSREVGINRKYQTDKPDADIPEQLPREVVVSKADHRETLRAISGVSLNLTGQSETKNEAASLFSQRVQQAGLMQSTMLDALRRADRYLGKQAIDGLQRYLRMERVIRLTEDNEDPMWLILNEQTLEGVKNDVSIGRYDLELDESAYSATAKQEGFIQGVTLAKMMPPELIPWHLIINNSDIPDKRGWVKYIEDRLGILAGPNGGAASQQLLDGLLRAAAGGKATASPASDQAQPAAAENPRLLTGHNQS